MHMSFCRPCICSLIWSLPLKGYCNEPKRLASHFHVSNYKIIDRIPNIRQETVVYFPARAELLWNFLLFWFVEQSRISCMPNDSDQFLPNCAFKTPVRQTVRGCFISWHLFTPRHCSSKEKSSSRRQYSVLTSGIMGQSLNLLVYVQTLKKGQPTQ